MPTHHFTAQELSRWAKDFSKILSAKTVVLLDGPLGAGKTQLVQSVLKNLVSSPITSPTFSLIHEYQGAKVANIYHIDLYRLEGSENLESTGFWDLFAQENTIIFIEWAELLDRSELPLDWRQIHIQIDLSAEADKRSYEITGIEN